MYSLNEAGLLLVYIKSVQVYINCSDSRYRKKKSSDNAEITFSPPSLVCCPIAYGIVLFDGKQGWKFEQMSISFLEVIVNIFKLCVFPFVLKVCVSALKERGSLVYILIQVSIPQLLTGRALQFVSLRVKIEAISCHRISYQMILTAVKQVILCIFPGLVVMH